MKDKIMFQGTDISKVFEYYNDKEEQKKHLKGYMYDSLVYRYQLALEQAIPRRVDNLLASRDFHSVEDAEVKVRDLNLRDLMRFCEILDEAIGDHD